MLTNFKPHESIASPGEYSIHADSDDRQTVVCIISRDNLSDVFGEAYLDARDLRWLVDHHLDKFGRVIAWKFQFHRSSFQSNTSFPHQLHGILTPADFTASGESFTKAELLDAIEARLAASAGSDARG
jgi:hypothetical protein